MGSSFYKEKSRTLETAYRALRQELGRVPSDEEVAKHLNITVEALRQMVHDVSYTGIASFDEMLSSPNVGAGSISLALADLLSDKDSPDPLKMLEENELITRLKEAIQKLSEKERTVIALYYFEGMTLAEIGVAMDFTESWVSQLHSRGVEHLRAALGDFSENIHN